MLIYHLLLLHGTTPLDLLLWRRYGREVAGLTEQTFAANPHIADLGFCPPLGTKVLVTIPPTKTEMATKTVSLYD